MKAMVLTKPGSIDGLEYVENREIPEPKEREIRVKVMAAGLNPVDYKLIQGWGEVDWKNPPVLGLDVAGIVDKTGSQVKDFSPAAI